MSDERTFFAEDVEHMLNQIDKILEIYSELIQIGSITHVISKPFDDEFLVKAMKDK